MHEFVKKWLPDVNYTRISEKNFFQFIQGRLREKSRAEPGSSCQIWQGGIVKKKNGTYGKISWKGKTLYAYRTAYMCSRECPASAMGG